MTKKTDAQPRMGLYTPELEKDACGVGLLCDLKATPSHYIVDSALTILENMKHRGACGAEKNTGDGAGILTQIPHHFFVNIARATGINIPEANNYGVGMFFFPKDPIKKQFCETIIKKHIHFYGMVGCMKRAVPVDNSILGSMALETEPEMEQWFVKFKKKNAAEVLENQLFFLRSSILNDAYQQDTRLIDDFYISSFSSKTIVYKGQLSAIQLRSYFLDLQDQSYTSALAIVHSRFSTNTIPKWKLAQPFRCISHNGEINTIQGNINWWQAREKRLHLSDTFDPKLKNILPICDPYISDSGNFDNVLEFLLRSGRSLAHAMMMMIPEAWQNDEALPSYKKAFYKFHDAILEPWDGPASICFTDGTVVGAALDRNGLRPSRYTITEDGIIILGSEAGCLGLDQSKIIKKSRLQPGKVLLIDLNKKRIISDEEVKETICKKFPYQEWIEKHTLDIKDLENNSAKSKILVSSEELHQKQIAFGFSKEDEDLIVKTMATEAKEPIGSMGADIPLAILSKIAQHPANYFKQQFAQVTNPPIDSLREKFFMSLQTYLGGTGRIITIRPQEAAVLRLDSPLLSTEVFEKIQGLKKEKFHFAKVSLVFHPTEGIEAALNRISNEVEMAAFHSNIICLSDRKMDQDHLPMPTLLAVGCIHHFLIACGKRKKISLIIEGGDIWETHHIATLLSYGADAIYPYLTLECCKVLARKMGHINASTLTKSYLKAAEKGLLKIMSKLGISSLNSYKGAQTFEALGISQKVVDKCFKGTISRIGGISFKGLQKELEVKHKLAFAKKSNYYLPDLGFNQWKKTGEFHLFNPQSIHLLQHATRLNQYQTYKLFTKEIDRVAKNASTLRSFLKIKKGSQAIPLKEVEPVEKILQRFATGAMSFGSISQEAHSTLAIAMNRIGGKSNSGEGGEDERRFDVLKEGDSMKSAIKQVASGRFGVTINYLTNAKELQIKMAQGAKPGEGGQLPGHKVDKNIAKVRHCTPGVGLISPPPHHDIYSIEDLAQLIFDLKNANQAARISVKLVSKAGVGVIASGVAKAHADHILISGADGGTGASPLSSVRHAGLPWELGLSETHQTLVKNKLRDRVVLQADGQIRTGRDLAIATMLGAEEWGIATAALVVEGCILMRKCHLNTCPVGIATQDPTLRKKFTGKVEHLVNYFYFLAEDLREIMATVGVRTVNDLVGRTDLLTIDKIDKHWKTKNLNLETLLYQFDPGENQSLYATKQQDHELNAVLDRSIIQQIDWTCPRDSQLNEVYEIKNTNRAVGTMLSHEIAKRYGSQGLPEDSIKLQFRGSAGQSFAAFAAKGLSFFLEGEANDYFGKGLSGANLCLVPDRDSVYPPEENIIVGNVALYGATAGTVLIKGLAGDRFCVRNSGTDAVIEGIGDNGCEYMTGGSVVVLGKIGRNFAAGMSGGFAFIYRNQDNLLAHINQDMVLIESLDEEDKMWIQQKIKLHFKMTSSKAAFNILSNWKTEQSNFVKIFPKELKAILAKNKTQSAIA
ncbi:MAG: glutamate synthase large subunit [Saprospiraceae bacterium]